MRKTWRSRRKRSASLLRYKQRAPIGIGRSRDAVKRDADAAEAEHIRRVHDQVWNLRASCQLCHGTRHTWLPDQMHEDPSRSATRGLPLADRFNVRVCGRLCAPCHDDVTHKRIRVVFADPVRRFDGLVTWEPYGLSKSRRQHAS